MFSFHSLCSSPCSLTHFIRTSNSTQNQVKSVSVDDCILLLLRPQFALHPGTLVSTKTKLLLTIRSSDADSLQFVTFGCKLRLHNTIESIIFTILIQWMGHGCKAHTRPILRHRLYLIKSYSQMATFGILANNLVLGQLSGRLPDRIAFKGRLGKLQKHSPSPAKKQLLAVKSTMSMLSAYPNSWTDS